VINKSLQLLITSDDLIFTVGFRDCQGGWKLLTCKNYLHVGSLCQFYVCQTALVLQRLKLCQHYQHIHETYYTGYNNYTGYCTV